MDFKQLFSKPHSVKRIDGFSKFIIYGAGNTGKDVLRFITGKLHKEVISFIDLKASGGSMIEDVPVESPDSNVFSESVKNDCLVIIAIFNRDVNLIPITSLLRSKGFKQVISFVQFHHFYADHLSNKYWLSDTRIYQRYIPQLNELHRLLSDQESKVILESILKYRATGDAEELTEPE